jgi:hypothetical protein
MGFLIWIPAGTKHVLSADRIFFYVRSSCIWRFIVSRRSPMFWGKCGVEHADMQHSECVSMSGLHKSQDRTSISIIAAEIF